MNRPRLSAIINRHDPIGIIFEADNNRDEYAPEVNDIWNRLPACRTQDEVQELLWRVFSQWFGNTSTGPKERFHPIAEDIWLNLRE